MCVLKAQKMENGNIWFAPRGSAGHGPPSRCNGAQKTAVSRKSERKKGEEADRRPQQPARVPEWRALPSPSCPCRGYEASQALPPEADPRAACLPGLCCGPETGPTRTRARAHPQRPSVQLQKAPCPVTCLSLVSQVGAAGPGKVGSIPVDAQPGPRDPEPGSLATPPLPLPAGRQLLVPVPWGMGSPRPELPVCPWLWPLLSLACAWGAPAAVSLLGLSGGDCHWSPAHLPVVGSRPLKEVTSHGRASCSPPPPTLRLKQQQQPTTYVFIYFAGRRESGLEELAAGPWVEAACGEPSVSSAPHPAGKWWPLLVTWLAALFTATRQGLRCRREWSGRLPGRG